MYCMYRWYQYCSEKVHERSQVSAYSHDIQATELIAPVTVLVQQVQVQVPGTGESNK